MEWEGDDFLSELKQGSALGASRYFEFELLILLRRFSAEGLSTKGRESVRFLDKKAWLGLALGIESPVWRLANLVFKKWILLLEEVDVDELGVLGILVLVGSGMGEEMIWLSLLTF